VSEERANFFKEGVLKMPSEVGTNVFNPTIPSSVWDAAGSLLSGDGAFGYIQENPQVLTTCDDSAAWTTDSSTSTMRSHLRKKQ
jgi:hypothetical protein